MRSWAGYPSGAGNPVPVPGVGSDSCPCGSLIQPDWLPGSQPYPWASLVQPLCISTYNGKAGLPGAGAKGGLGGAISLVS